jgi:uncharacterized repeat protein (TIGR03803 family)
MKRSSFVRCAAWSVAGLSPLAPRAFANPALQTVVTFDGSIGAPNGGMVVSGGTIYGTTSSGIVYSVPTSGGTPTALASLSNPNALNSNLLLSGSTLYGVLSTGGPNGGGEIFSLPTNGGTPSAVVSFDGTGQTPSGPLTLSNGMFYGTSYGPSPGFSEFVYSAPSAGGAPATLASIPSNDTAGGFSPGVALHGNTLYLLTGGDGITSRGLLLSVPVSGGSATTVGRFLTANHVTEPDDGLIVVGNSIFGTTYNTNFGFVYSAPLSGGDAMVNDFFQPGEGGAHPEGGMVLLGDSFYGTTSGTINEAPGSPTVFAAPVAGGDATTLAYFPDYGSGVEPVGDPTLAGSTLYIAASPDSAVQNNDGTIYAIVVPEPATFSAGILLAVTLLGRRPRGRQTEGRRA